MASCSKQWSTQTRAVLTHFILTCQSESELDSLNLTASCLSSLLWISCYFSEITQVSLISHSFALIPSLSTTRFDSLRLSLCFDLFMYLSQKNLSQSILYPLWKLARALRNNHKSRRRTNLSSPWAAHGGPAYLPGPWLPVSTHHLLNTSVSPCICASRLPFSHISHLKSWVFTTYELSSGQTLSGVCKRCPWFHFETHWRWERTGKKRLICHMLQRKDAAVFVLQTRMIPPPCNHSEFISFPFRMVETDVSAIYCA